MILITSTGELFLYFTIIFFSFHKNKKEKEKLLQDCFWVALLLLQESIFCGSKILKARLSGKIDCDQMEEGEQYSEYLVERNPRSYMPMRDYRNFPW